MSTVKKKNHRTHFTKENNVTAKKKKKNRKCLNSYLLFKFNNRPCKSDVLSIIAIRLLGYRNENLLLSERSSLIIFSMSWISFQCSLLIVSAWHLQKSPLSFWSKKQRTSFPWYSHLCHTGTNPFKVIWKRPTELKGQISPACLWLQPEGIYWLNAWVHL